MSQLMIQQSDHGKTFAIDLGDQFVIQLAENPSTGYQWQVISINDRIVVLQASNYENASGVAMGGGGTKTFVYQAKTLGTDQIRLILQREWEPQDKAIDRFAVTIHVQ